MVARERILIVEVNWLGDILFSTPAIRALRRRYPRAYLAALVVPRGREVLEGNEYLDEIIVLDEEGRHRGFWGKARLILELRARHFTEAYFLRPSVTRTLCAALAGIRRRVGFDKKGRLFLTSRVAMPDAKQVHRADIYYTVVAGEKIPARERFYDFSVSAADRVFIEHFLEQKGIGRGKLFASLHVGGNWDLKRWPEESFARLADGLTGRFGIAVVLTGSSSDEVRALAIASRAAGPRPAIACGQTSLKQLGALFAKSVLVVSADSGPLHIASAVGARTVALFGPTSESLTGPLGAHEQAVMRGSGKSTCVIPCYDLSCPDNVCMKSIAPDAVIGEVERRGWLKPQIA